MKRMITLKLKTKNGEIAENYNGYTTRINLGHLDLTEFPSIETLSKFVNLQILHLHNNQLKEIPSEINQLINLRKLDLAHNLFGDAKFLHKIGELLNLEELILSDNKIVILPSTFSMLTKLTRLDLQNNQINDITILSKLKKLNALYLAKNQIMALPSKLINLRYLSLYHNPIKYLRINKFVNLQYLSLSADQLYGINKCINLLTLHIIDGKLKILSDDIITLKISYLDLDNNLLKFLPISHITMEYLRIYSNQIIFNPYKQNSVKKLYILNNYDLINSHDV